MHELSITQSTFSIALEKAESARAKRVTRVNLTFGELSGVVDDCVRFYFGFLSKNTIAAQAELAFNHRPIELRCGNCQATFSPRKADWSCPKCRRRQAELVAGRECYVESIEVE